MVRALRLALPSILLPVAFALTPASALAGANTFYAAPAGSGAACEEAEKPCDLDEAVSLAKGGDIVVLAPGTYALKAGGLGIGKGIEIGGLVGGADSTVLDTTGGNVHVSPTAKATLHDMRIEGAGGLLMSSGIAERLFVSYTGTASGGCHLEAGVKMSDSVCWAHNPAAISSAIEAGASGVTGTVTLRNVTAYASSGSGSGIYASASAGGKLTVDAVDVIARGEHHSDLVAILNGGGTTSAIDLSHSNYATLQESPPASTVTAAGTNGNQTAAPVFVDVAGGDFRAAAGSPTVEAGAVPGPEELLGFEGRQRLDLAGGIRVQPMCLGATPVIDIGAYEATPVDCSVPSNRFNFRKVKLNRRKGTALLTIEVPGPGSLQLTGKGLKSVSKSPSAAGDVRMALVPTGKAKARLAETGVRTVVPRVTFTPVGGSPLHKARTTKLRQRLG
jgi:hypothetical protein